MLIRRTSASSAASAASSAARSMRNFACERELAKNCGFVFQLHVLITMFRLCVLHYVTCYVIV